MNEIGKSGWEIYHVREEFNANWDDERLVRGIAASSATEQIDLVLNTPEANAEREANLIFFYARRPGEGASS